MNRKGVWASIVLCSTLVISACSGSKTATKTIEKEAINVETIAVQKESLDGISLYSGKLAPYEEINVSFKIGGTIQTMTADIGDQVSAGSTLASLNTKDLELEVEKASTSVLQARAGILAAEAQISSADANIHSANAQISSAKANLAQVESGARAQEIKQAKIALDKATAAYKKLKKDLSRTQTLYTQGLISEQDLDNLKLQVENAQKDVASAEESYSLIKEGATKSQRTVAKSGITQAEAGKSSAEAAKRQATAAKGQAEASYEQALIGKKQAEQSLSKTNLNSPTAGVILEKLVTEGEQVNAGTAVYQIGSIDQLKVLLPVPDKEIGDWKVGDDASVSLYNKTRKGQVTKIYPATNQNTGTINVEIVIPNPKHDWLPGQVINANRISNDNQGILIPVEAVLSNGSDPYVFKVVDNHAVKTTVTTGDMVGNSIHIVSGLEENDQIVIRGGELLLDGDPVKVTATGGETP